MLCQSNFLVSIATGNASTLFAIRSLPASSHCVESINCPGTTTISSRISNVMGTGDNPGASLNESLREKSQSVVCTYATKNGIYWFRLLFDVLWFRPRKTCFISLPKTFIDRHPNQHRVMIVKTKVKWISASAVSVQMKFVFLGFPFRWSNSLITDWIRFIFTLISSDACVVVHGRHWQFR